MSDHPEVLGADVTDKEAWKEVLRETPLIVEFTKTDGTIRTITCSLRSEDMPPFPARKLNRVKKEKPKILDVIDLEKKAWRSFRLDSVRKITIVTEKE